MLVFATVVVIALLVSGLLEIAFSYQEQRNALERLQSERAEAAVDSIQNFFDDTQRAIGWTMPPGRLDGPDGLIERRDDYLRLLRETPAVSEVSYIDARGREQIRLSRRSLNRMGSGQDFSREPVFMTARAAGVFYGPVYFRNDLEPSMTISIAEVGGAGGVTVTQVNLKAVWQAVARPEGDDSQVFVVDSAGRLITHQDSSLVVRQIDVSAFPLVVAARAAIGDGTGAHGRTLTAADPIQGEVLATYRVIDPPGWVVFVQQPIGEVFAPVYMSLLRPLVVIGLGLMAAVAGSLLLDRRLVSDVGRDDERAAGQLARDLFEPISVARREHDMGASGGEGPCRGRADAGGCAGDNHSFTGGIHLFIANTPQYNPCGSGGCCRGQ